MKSTIRTIAIKDETGKMVAIKGTIYSHKMDIDTYSIMVVNNTKRYRLNGSPWSNTINDIHNTHYAIEDHYKI